MKHLVTILFFACCQHSFGQTFCLTIDNPEILNNGTEFQFDISMSGSAPFGLGSSNLQFGFNSSALALSPVLAERVDHYNAGFDAFSGFAYDRPTLTLPSPNQASLNIVLNFPPAALQVSNGGNTFLARVKFIITNPLATSNLTWSYTGGTTQTVVYNSTPVRLLATAPNCLQGLSTLLPLELLKFHAQAKQRSIALDWLSAEEHNFSGFDLERSEDGRSFEKINWVAGKGGAQKNDYQYDDRDVVAGQRYYYRLKMVDLDGSYRYSDIESAQIESKGGAGLQVWPTPTSTGFNAVFHVEKESNSTWLLTNSLGQIISDEVLEMEKGDNSRYFDLSNYPAGMYYLNVLTSTSQFSEKVLKLE